jgi:glutathione peroxidase-family protein
MKKLPNSEEFEGFSEEEDEDLEDLAQEKYQKVILFAEKTKVIGDHPWDVKQNLKDLIEVM